MKKKINLWTLLFIGPYFILFIIFFLIPAVFGIAVSFTEWDMYNTPEFIGFSNYNKILFDSQYLLRSVPDWYGKYNTFCSVCGTFVCICSATDCSAFEHEAPRTQAVPVSAVYAHIIFNIGCYDYLVLPVVTFLRTFQDMV